MHLVAACLFSLCAQTGGAPWLELPDDPMGRLWASVGEDTEPWSPEESGAQSWGRWAQAIEAVSVEETVAVGQSVDEAPLTRREALAFLVEFAARDLRGEDAFRWLQVFGADEPEAMCGLLPRLFPGVPSSARLEPGGRPAPLDQGITLRPMLPPAPADRRVARRATCRGLRIGDATLDLVLKLDGSGVVCDFTHRSGGPVTFWVQLPAPEGVRLKSLYVDWELQLPPGADPNADPHTLDELQFDWSREPVKITVTPQPTGDDDPGYAESFSVFARLAAREAGIPATPLRGPKGELPALLEQVGLALEVDPAQRDSQGDFGDWHLLAASWSAATGLDVRVSLPRASASGTAASAPAPIAVRFWDAPDPDQLRRQLTSAIEAYRRP